MVADFRRTRCWDVHKQEVRLEVFRGKAILGGLDPAELFIFVLNEVNLTHTATANGFFALGIAAFEDTGEDMSNPIRFPGVVFVLA